MKLADIFTKEGERVKHKAMEGRAAGKFSAESSTQEPLDPASRKT